MLELGRAAAQQLLDDSKAALSDAGGTASSAEAALASASIAAPLMLPGVGGGVLPALRCLLSFPTAAASEAPQVQLQSRGGGVQPVTHLQAGVARQAGVSAVRGSTGATVSCGSMLRQFLIAEQPKAAAAQLAACGALELHAEHAAPGWHCHPAALDATLHLALCAEPSPQHAQHGGGDDAAPAPPAKVPVAAACFRAPAQGQGAGSGGASWPLMVCDAAGPAATTASYALLGGSGAAAFHLHRLQSRAVGGRTAGAAAAAATAAAAVAGARPGLASYSVQHAVHLPASRGAAVVGGRPEAAVSLSAGAVVSALLPAQPSGLPLAAAVFGGAQSVLRRLQESQQLGSSVGNPVRLVAATGVPSGCFVAPSRNGSGAAAEALAAAALAMLKCAAAEPSWQGGQPHCATHSSLAPVWDCAAAAEADAPAGDLFAAPHRSQSAWLLPQLLGEPEAQAGTAGTAAAAAINAAAGQLAAEAAGGVAISGGLGALGLLAAAWLAGGSRLPCSIALWGRSASSQLPPTALRASLAPVSAVQCDVSVAADAAAAAGLRRSVGSYWHAGGVLRDGLLAQQSASALRAALAPKLGGWLAAAAALAVHPLRCQLFFSSVAALLGNAGQANYAAANAALDAAAAATAACGMAAASLQWGPWAGGGMANAAVAASLAAKGVGLVQPAAGLALLDALLSWRQPGSAVVAPLVALDWRRMLRPAQRASPFFAAVITAARPAPAAATPNTLNNRQASAAAAAAAAAAPSLQQVREAVLELAAAAAAGVALHPDAAFMSSGLDSLGACCCFTFSMFFCWIERVSTLLLISNTPSVQATDAVGGGFEQCAPFCSSRTARAAGVVELRAALSSRFQLDLPATAALDYPTPAALAAHVHAQLAAAAADAAAAAADNGGGEGSDTEATGLSGWGAWAAPWRARRAAGAAAKASGQRGGTGRQREGAVLRQLEGIAAGVLGAAVSPQQPLMEASRCCCHFFATGCCTKRSRCARVFSHQSAQSAAPSLAASVAQPASPLEQPVSHHTPPRVLPLQAGLDSLSALELRAAVGSAFGLDLPPTLAFDHPTLAALAAYVAASTAVGEEEENGAEAAVGASLALASGGPPGALGGVTALVAASGRYPQPSTAGSAAAGDLLGSGTAGGTAAGNADLSGFAGAAAAGAAVQRAVPPQRWNVDGVYDPQGGPRRSYVRFGGWLRGLAGFDAAAFRLSARSVAATPACLLGCPPAMLCRTACCLQIFQTPPACSTPSQLQQLALSGTSQRPASHPSLLYSSTHHPT
jgi:acyl carrier protein